MKHLFIALVLMVALNGCQEKAQEDQRKHDEKIAQQARAEVIAEYEAQKAEEKEKLAQEEAKAEDTKHNKLHQVGIDMNEGTLTIDTNKTKNFFNTLTEKMDIQMKKISHDLEKGIVEAKELGVEINEEHIHIDLNKTQDLLETWGKKLQVFVQEFDDITSNIENNDTNRGK